ncbi:hypothetical protein FA95DRAFT_1613404 [Auriscalpium vulgare]|uniref:Uncharacterized protein n=1 Tax=Auriscalpium vulgare TaxID=40419 RepID=A0ACB8R3B6_9AGAM|nr:hypothetical protein FA95DRAFT_1613404 [Auriscalpium vulgare]
MGGDVADPGAHSDPYSRRVKLVKAAATRNGSLQTRLSPFPPSAPLQARPLACFRTQDRAEEPAKEEAEDAEERKHKERGRALAPRRRARRAPDPARRDLRRRRRRRGGRDGAGPEPRRAGGRLPVARAVAGEERQLKEQQGKARREEEERVCKATSCCNHAAAAIQVIGMPLAAHTHPQAPALPPSLLASSQDLWAKQAPATATSSEWDRGWVQKEATAAAAASKATEDEAIKAAQKDNKAVDEAEFYSDEGRRRRRCSRDAAPADPYTPIGREGFYFGLGKSATVQPISFTGRRVQAREVAACHRG